MKSITALFMFVLVMAPMAQARDQASGAMGGTTAQSGQTEMMCTVVSVDTANNQVTLDHNGKQHTITPSGDSMPLQDLKKGDSVHVMLDPNDQSKGAVHKQ